LPVILANPVGNASSNQGTIGDAFNQSYYFMRAGGDLKTSQWSINSTNIDPYPLPPSEIFNQNLIALGNNQIDFGTSGIYPGCLSLYHFLKHYFCHILSLENLSGDGQFSAVVILEMVQLLRKKYVDVSLSAYCE